MYHIIFNGGQNVTLNGTNMNDVHLILFNSNITGLIRKLRATKYSHITNTSTNSNKAHTFGINQCRVCTANIWTSYVLLGD